MKDKNVKVTKKPQADTPPAKNFFGSAEFIAAKKKRDAQIAAVMK